MHKHKFRSTLIGFSAVLLWSTLALLTKLAGAIPPLELTALTFAVATLIGIVMWSRQGGSILTHLRLPASAWAVGVFGLFGYHLVYFIALQNAPAAEASLIAYLWPLLIVLFSALLPNERLYWFHIIGALIGFAGAALLLTKGQQLVIDARYSLGYLAALACAFIWSIYSVLSRRLGAVPTSAVGGFCAVTAVLSLLAHLMVEETVWPSLAQWLPILALGLGPVGLAFFTWDHGVKHGDIQTLGVLSYAAPLLSTILLVVTGQAAASWLLGFSCLMIVGGALLASGILSKK
ncbi:MAG: EamA family transporter [Caldilineaceae bacterium]